MPTSIIFTFQDFAGLLFLQHDMKKSNLEITSIIVSYLGRRPSCIALSYTRGDLHGVYKILSKTIAAPMPDEVG